MEEEGNANKDIGEKEKNEKISMEVIIVLSMAFVASMSYWQLTPFYPSFIKKKKIDKIYLGLVLATFAFFFLVSAWFTGSFLLLKTQRINGCFIGAFFVVSNFIFPIFYIDNQSDWSWIIGIHR